MNQIYRIFSDDYGIKLKESKKFFTYPEIFKPIFEENDCFSYLNYINNYSVWMKYLCVYFFYYGYERNNEEFK